MLELREIFHHTLPETEREMEQFAFGMYVCVDMCTIARYTAPKRNNLASHGFGQWLFLNHPNTKDTKVNS